MLAIALLAGVLALPTRKSVRLCCAEGRRMISKKALEAAAL